jgi:menaquinone-specific isochorismate synthase
MEPELLRLANVQHLATPFAGRLDRETHILELVRALHPTPAVGGVPTADALEVIAALEGMDRNRYAGPVGFFRSNGDGEFAIALRCAELSGARARLFAGNGIVNGSVPEDELEETRLKLAAMLSALD